MVYFLWTKTLTLIKETIEKYTLSDHFLHINVYVSIFEIVSYFELMGLYEEMKSRRRILSLSQQDLAEMAGIGLSTIKDIERGKGNPSITTVSKILEVLGMEIVFKVRQTCLILFPTEIILMKYFLPSLS